MHWYAAFLIAAAVGCGLWCAASAVRRWSHNPIEALSAFVLVAAVVAVAAFVRYEPATAHNAMYLDEPWYAEAACNMTRSGRLELCEETWNGRSCGPFEKSPGWPVLLALVATFRGCDAAIGIRVNRVIGSTTPALIIVAAAAAGAAWWQGAFAGLLVALHPEHVEWSTTGETNVAAAAALLLSLCGALWYRRRASAEAAAVAITALALAAAIRPEVAVAAIASGWFLATAGPSDRNRRTLLLLALAILTGVAALSGASLWAMNRATSGGIFFSIANVAANITALAGTIHVPFALVIAGGAAMMVYRGRGAAVGLMAGAAALTALIVLAYDRFSPRMLLATAVVAAPMAAFLFDWKARRLAASAALAAAGVFGSLWIDSLAALAMPSATQLLQTRIAAVIAAQSLAGDVLIVAEQPTVVAAAGFEHVMSTREALRDINRLAQLAVSGRAVYYLQDMYCEDQFAGGRGPERCRAMSQKFVLTPVVTERLDDREYVLYAVGAVETRG